MSEAYCSSRECPAKRSQPTVALHSQGGSEVQDTGHKCPKRRNDLRMTQYLRGNLVWMGALLVSFTFPSDRP